MKAKLFEKLCSGFLALSLLTSTGITQTVGESFGTNLTVSAADSLTYGDYEYTIDDFYNTVTITKYKGTDTQIAVPSAINGQKVKIIGSNAFSGCSTLISITIPTGVTSIRNYAFADCASLTSITIPDSVLSIGDFIFDGCLNLTSITVDENNDVYSSQNGILFNKDKNKILVCPCAKTGTYVIPDSITSIEDGAFYCCSKLTNITIPNSVTSIGEWAFADCSELTGIIIPNSVTSIKDGTFRNCSGLTSITIPASVTSIGKYAFTNCNNLTIYGNAGSYAETYAKDNNIPFTEKEPTSELKYISELSITLSPTSYVYDGTAKQPAVTVKDNETTLIPGVDYTLEYADNVNAGTAKVTVTGREGKHEGISYGGSVTETFTIHSKPVSELTIILNPQSYIYDGTFKRPSIIVRDGEKILVPEIDYDSAYTNSINSGMGSVTITGKGNYTGTLSKTFKINPKSISSAELTVNPLSFTYDGTEKIPAVTLKDGDKTLILNTDYSLKYENNINAGTAKVIVNGKGNYTDTLSKTFKINPKSISNAELTVNPMSFTYDGTKKYPAVTVKDGDKTLVLNTDYSLEYEGNINAGTAKVTVIGKGNYIGTLSKTFKINPKSISNAELTINPMSFTYDSTKKIPSVTVNDGTKTLVLNTDYSLEYEGNINAGTAKVTVTGKENYTGTLSKTFKINPKSISNAELTIDSTEFTYDGTARKPKVTVKDSDKTLVLNTDYSLEYKNNVNAGTATVTVTGMGNYTDSLSRNFTIKPKSISNAELTVNPTEFIYDGTAKEPKVTVKDGEKTLVLNTDYSVSYSDNVNVGTATVTVKGKKNYIGTAKTAFSIIEPPLKFEWNSDNWQFENSGKYIENVPYSEKINSTYLDVLKENLSYSEYKKIFWGEGREQAWLHTTGGSCYGMSAVAFLAEYGFMDFSDYQTNADKLYDLDAPIGHSLNDLSDKSNVSSLITYYQLLQVKDVIRQKYRKVSNQNNKTNIQELLALLDENDVVLVGYQWGTEKNPLAHAVLAYGYSYEQNTFNGVTYDGYIKIYDPNYSYNNTAVYIYFNQSTYHWIIPGKNLSSSGYPSVKFSYINADSDEINDGGYLDSNTNNDDSDEFIARIDAPVISDERFVSKVAQSSGVYMQSGGDNDIVEDYSYILNGTVNGIFGYNLYDPDSAYEVSQKNPAQLELHMDYENCDLYGYSSLGKSVTFDKKGFVSIEGKTGDYEMAMTFDRDYPTDWFYINVSGTDAKDISLLKTKNGYVLSGDNLKKIQICTKNMTDSASIGFSTDYKKVFIYEIDKNTIGLKADKDNNGTYETSIKGVPILENNSYLSSESIQSGSTVTVIASGKGGEGDLQYAVYCKKTSESKWTLKQDYSTNTTVSVKFDKAADYDICVKVKDSKGTVEKKYFILNVYDILTNRSAISDTAISLGSSVTLYALATGGTGDYTYAVYYKQKAQSKWTLKQDFGSNNTIIVKPSKAVNYDICVKIRDSSGTVEKKYFVVSVSDVLVNTSTVSADKIKLGATVSVKASAAGGVGNYTYAVYYKQQSQSKWTLKQDFNKNTTISVTPAKATDYDICVKVKDNSGTVEKKYFVVSVSDVLKNTSTIPQTQIDLGSEVSVKCSATGGTGNYTYSVLYKQKSQSKWTVAQDFDSNDKVIVKPAKAVDYDICVKVKDSSGTVEKKYFEITVK